jgi:hypothetical protein
MYPESQDATEEMKPALLEMAAVFEAIICPYASKLVKSMDFVNKFFFGAKFDYFYRCITCFSMQLPYFYRCITCFSLQLPDHLLHPFVWIFTKSSEHFATTDWIG